MPRIRTIKPDFWSDRRMVKLTPYARLFYMGMWNFALCDRGHLPDDAEELKLKILPVDDVDPDALLQELLDADRVRRYETPDGETYLWAWKLAQHQKVDGRWQPRCPYCALGVTPENPGPRPNSRESAGGSPNPTGKGGEQEPRGDDRGSQNSAHHTETPDNSRESQGVSPKLTGTPAGSPELPGEGKGREGREGGGGTAPLESSPRGRASAPPPDDSSPRSWTETLLAEHCAKQRRPPPAKERSKIAEQIHALLADEKPFTPDEVRSVLEVWAGRPVGPGVIGSIADELFCRRDGSGTGTVTALDRQRGLPDTRAAPGGSDANLDKHAALVAELQAMETR